MNQYLYDDDYLIWVFGDDAEAKSVKTLFSRYEEYSLYQGLNRESTASDYLNYAKVFIRADTKRTDVKRKYQKVMEFYADASSLLIALYDILIIIFNFINNFWAEQTLSKKIFFFKDLEESGLNVKKRTAQIKEMLQNTSEALKPGKTSQKNSVNENIDNLEGLTKKDSETIRALQNDDIKIYNSKKRIQNYSKKDKEYEKIKVSGSNVDDYDNDDKTSNKYKGRESKNSLNYRYNMNMKNRNNYRYYYNNESEDYNESQIQTSKDEAIEEESDPYKIEFDFNICEVLGSTIFKYCQSKELQIKYNLREKANSILFSKLDIVLYVRNMILFDIMNETLLSVGNKDVIKFLGRPIISLKGKEKDELSIFYHGYKSSDFNKFYNEINDLSQKTDKLREEKEILSLTNKHLKSLLV